MSYLLKALEKAQKERETQGSEESVEVAPVVQQAQLPRSVLLLGVVLLCAVFYSVFKQDVVQQGVEGDYEFKGSVPVVSKPEKHFEKDGQQVVGAVNELESPESAQLQKFNSPESVETKPLDLVELDAVTLKALPSIQFQSHIYSSASEYRSVMLNDRSLREGMPVSAEVRLQEITPTGIILEVNGVQVQLPKGQDWIAAQ